MLLSFPHHSKELIILDSQVLQHLFTRACTHAHMHTHKHTHKQTQHTHTTHTQHTHKHNTTHTHTTQHTHTQHNTHAQHTQHNTHTTHTHTRARGRHAVANIIVKWLSFLLRVSEVLDFIARKVTVYLD
jgi:hypothetical protein